MSHNAAAKKIILVTGGAGYIGSHFCKHARGLGFETVVYDNFSTGHREFVHGACVEGDILDTQLLTQTLKDHCPLAVVHFAAKSIVSESMQFPELYFKNNREGTRSVVEAMQAANISRLVFSSSCAVYGAAQTPLISENHPKKPVNPYGQSKLEAEEIVIQASQAGKIRASVLRYFNVVGQSNDGDLWEWHEPETHLLPNVVRAIEKGEVFKLFGNDFETPDGTAIRDYVDVNDLARAHFVALERLDQQNLLVSNVGVGQGYSNLEVVKTVAEVLGKEKPEIELCPRRPGDLPILLSNTTFFKTWYPYSTVALKDSIRSLTCKRK